MSKHTATVSWERDGEEFTDNRYSRAHTWLFDGGAEVRASSSPHIVPEPMSEAAAVDPEEAFVASLASCHMLWFLAIASKRGFVVDSYRDQPSGTMGRDSEGRTAMTELVLRPQVEFGGEQAPTKEQLDEMHHEAHDKCFIANSVKTNVRCEPQL